MEDLCGWFKIEVIYPITASFNDDEEISEVDRIRLKNEGIVDDYETGIAYFNLSQDNIRQIHPKAFIPKGKTNKKYITEIVFNSGVIVYANEKTDRVYERLNDYLRDFPILPSQQE